MWRECYKETGAPVVAGLLAIAAIAGCSPDGPGAGVPTHPSDTWSVALEWDAPTTDAVGRPLEDLSGYRLYYREAGTAPGSESMVELGSETRATVEGLSAGDYLFAVTALDTLGNESDLSDPLPVEVGP
jgi:hypothetical protein